MSTSFSNLTLRQGMELLWGATLEVWAHQLLYVRRVYPQETFGSIEYQGITTCKACRHPEVASYIRDTVQAAVPSLLSGTSKSISLRIVERDEMTETVAHEWEVYTLRMLELSYLSLSSSSVPKYELLKQLESALRTLILNVQGLPHGHVSTTTGDQCNLDQLSFEITLHCAPSNQPPNGDARQNQQAQTCPELVQGLNTGVWSETASRLENSRSPTARVLRPLYVLDTILCRLDFSLQRCKQVPVSRKKPPPSTSIQQSPETRNKSTSLAQQPSSTDMPPEEQEMITIDDDGNDDD